MLPRLKERFPGTFLSNDSVEVTWPLSAVWCRKNPSTLPSLVYIIAELTLARLCKWFVLVTSFPCKKYSSFGEEHKQRKKCSLLLLRGYSQEENWQLKLTAKVGIVNYVRSRPSLSPRQSVTYVIAVYFHNFLSIWEVDLSTEKSRTTDSW